MTRKFLAVLLAAGLALPSRAETSLAQDSSRIARIQRIIRSPDHNGHDFLVKESAPSVAIQSRHTIPIICALSGGCDLVLQAAFVLAEGRVIANASVVSIGYRDRLGLANGPRSDDRD